VQEFKRLHLAMKYISTEVWSFIYQYCFVNVSSARIEAFVALSVLLQGKIFCLT
jgi:hypothetical protein